MSQLKATKQLNSSCTIAATTNLGSISTTLNDTSEEPQVNLTYGTYNNKTILQQFVGTNITFKLSNLDENGIIGGFDGIVLMTSEVLQTATSTRILTVDPIDSPEYSLMNLQRE